MKTPLLITAVFLFLVVCETSTVDQTTTEAALTHPISKSAASVESVFGKPIVAQFDANVIGVTDGDTIKILKADKTQVRVQLQSIDCPEPKQSFGPRAKQAMNDLVFNKVVTILETGKDRFGRTLAFVVVDGVNTNEAMIRDGFAWHYKQFSDDETLAGLETEARATKRGLWTDAKPIAPWEFRKTESSKTND